MFRIVLILLFIFSLSIHAQSYSELVMKPVKELTVAQVNQTMLMRLNEMRVELKLKPLQYSNTIEKVAFYFMDHKTKWFEEDGSFVATAHFDDKNNGIIDRYKLFNIDFDKVVITEKRHKNGTVYTENKSLAGENVITTNGSVYELCEAWRKSPSHWAHISEKHYTHIGIAYRKGFPVLICDFVKFKTNK
jgi:hypothetical protein